VARSERPMSLRCVSALPDDPEMPDSTPPPHTPEVTVVVFRGGQLRVEFDEAALHIGAGNGKGARCAGQGRLVTVAPGADGASEATAQDRTGLALAAIAANPAGDHSVGVLAARVGVSVRHLSRLFVEHVGVTPARYVEQIRLAAARVMLAKTSARLPEIAAQAGFGSPETMRRAFLRAEGMPPGAYRDRRTTEDRAPAPRPMKELRR
jgi:AraC-like DNA-binding protein